MKKSTGVALFCVSLAGASAANAQPPPTRGDAATASAPPTAAAKEEAIARFKRGIELYQEADYQAALNELRRAHALAPTYRVHFNIGQVCYELKDYVCALTSFETYLKGGGDSVPAERRTSIQEDIERLKSRIASLAITANEAGVDITIDDVHVGTTPLAEPLFVNSGRRKITADKGGMRTVTRIVEVVGAESLKVDLVLPVGASSLTPVTAPLPPPSRWTKLSWAGLGVTGAFTAGAVVTGVLGRITADSVGDARFAGDKPPPELVAKSNRAEALAITTNVFIGAAVATLATTFIVTYARKPPQAEPATTATVSVDVSPFGAALHGTF